MSDNEYQLKSSFSLAGQNILITGAAGQIGSGLVSECLAAGAIVVASDADTDALAKIAKKRDWSKDRVAISGCDIRVKEQVQQLFDLGVERFGRVDSLINNAGVSVFEPFLERDEEAFDWVMDVNLKGTFFCIQEFTRRSLEHGGGGAMVNIASHYGVVSPDPRIYTDCPRKNSEVYGATKAGIIQMTRYFSVHLAEHDIRVNCIAPGGVRNSENPQGEDFQKNYGYRCPMGRMAEVNEIVGPVLFLLSPAASYINGQTLVVDGGMTAW